MERRGTLRAEEKEGEAGKGGDGGCKMEASLREGDSLQVKPLQPDPLFCPLRLWLGLSWP